MPGDHPDGGHPFRWIIQAQPSQGKEGGPKAGKDEDYRVKNRVINRTRYFILGDSVVSLLTDRNCSNCTALPVIATSSQDAPAPAPTDDPSAYYSAKRRRQPKQPEPVLVKNSGNSLSALAQMATREDSSAEERSAAHWSDVDDSDSDLSENKAGRKRAASRTTEKKPRGTTKGVRHAADSSRLVWTEDMVRHF